MQFLTKNDLGLTLGLDGTDHDCCLDEWMTDKSCIIFGKEVLRLLEMVQVWRLQVNFTPQGRRWPAKFDRFNNADDAAPPTAICARRQERIHGQAT